MKVFKFLSLYLIDFKLHIECLVCVELLIKLWLVVGYKVQKFAQLKEKKLIFLLALSKSIYSSCRIEVILYVWFFMFSIKIISTKTTTSSTFLILFLPCKYFSDIFISFCVWTVNSVRFCVTYTGSKNNHEKNWPKVNHNFYLFTFVILVHLLLKIYSSFLLPIS